MQKMRSMILMTERVNMNAPGRVIEEDRKRDSDDEMCTKF